MASASPAGGAPGAAAYQVILGHEPVEDRRELMQFGEVRVRQVGYHPVAFLGELYAHHTAVPGVGPASYEPCRLGAVHELHSAVMAQQKVVS